MVRLFGNVMSGVFVVGIVLSLVGLLVPVPLMALDLLTGAVQAYIFSVLAMVFIAGVLGEEKPPSALSATALSAPAPPSAPTPLSLRGAIATRQSRKSDRTDALPPIRTAAKPENNPR